MDTQGGFMNYHDSRMRQGLAKDDIFALKLSIVPNNHSFLRPKFLSVADDSFHQCSLSIQKFDHLVCYGKNKQVLVSHVI